jgi:hypothetical protein
MASFENSFGVSTAGGTTRGVASGATFCALAAFTPVFTSVPITIPIESVNSIKVVDKSFCCLILSSSFICFS